MTVIDSSKLKFPCLSITYMILIRLGGYVLFNFAHVCMGFPVSKSVCVIVCFGGGKVFIQVPSSLRVTQQDPLSPLSLVNEGFDSKYS
jgi:hypothetical protein